MMEAYTPFPVEGLAEALGFHRNRIAGSCFIGGLVGGIGGFFMQWYSAVVHFPLDVGGRPFNSWPAFIPITFELTILVGRVIGRAGDARRSTGCRGRITRSSTCRASPWRRATGSSSACRPAIRLFDLDRSRRFLEEQRPKAISVVPT